MNIGKYIYQDKHANLGNPTKGKYIVICFRLAQVIKRNKLLYILFFWYLLLYRVWVEWILCVELNWKTEVGPNLQLWHVHSLVVHPSTKIGRNCSLRQCTTIGVKKGADGLFGNEAPVIGDYVDIGSNVVIIGPIEIGNNVTIGAGSVVVKSIPPNCVVAGNPARIIKELQPID